MHKKKETIKESIKVIKILISYLSEVVRQCGKIKQKLIKLIKRKTK